MQVGKEEVVVFHLIQRSFHTMIPSPAYQPLGVIPFLAALFVEAHTSQQVIAATWGFQS